MTRAAVDQLVSSADGLVECYTLKSRVCLMQRFEGCNC